MKICSNDDLGMPEKIMAEVVRKPCVLCGAMSQNVGIFEFKAGGEFARSVGHKKDGLALYGVCDKCVARPNFEQEAEDKIVLRSLMERGVSGGVA
jgi:hypothetical protein